MDHTMKCETIGTLQAAAADLTIAVRRCCKQNDKAGIQTLRDEYYSKYPKQKSYVDDIITRAIAAYANDPYSKNRGVVKVIQRFRRLFGHL